MELKTGADDRSYFRNNNFDLIRLFAACQVVIFHCSNFPGVQYYLIVDALEWFPGVPIFFFISGFLISASWERSEDVHAFTVNRFLRIYPGLWMAFAVSAVLVLSIGRLDVGRHIGGVLAWAAANLTFLQSWNPSFLRYYGVGVANPALWTIPIELSFYALTPAIYWLGRRWRGTDAITAAVVLGSFAIQYWLFLTEADPATMMQKAVQFSTLPWLGMFCVGILAQRHIGHLYRFVAGKFWLILIVYAALSIAGDHLPLYPLIGSRSTSLGVLTYLVLCALILSAAYSFRGAADQILRRNDISYGVYIYHMVMMNVFMVLGFSGRWGLAMVFFATFTCASLSWFFLEKPALGLRRKVLYSHAVR